MKKHKKFIFIYILILSAILFVNYRSYSQLKNQPAAMTFHDMTALVERNSGTPMQLTEREDGLLILSMPNGSFAAAVSPKSNAASELVSKYPIAYSYVANDSLWATLAAYALPVLTIGLFLFLLNSQRKSNSSVASFAKSKSKEIKIPETTLEEVGGLSPETKAEIRQIIDLFNKQDDARLLGIRPSKGIIFHGPPGTGKTLLAKAFANAVQADFFAASGSSFVEMYVGVGASRMRDLFEKARSQPRSLVFIDEIDAIAGERKANGSEERENTLNELLVQLDGISTTSNVFFVCATNRLDILDAALLRPGRLDYKILINLPDLEGRKEIIKIHSKGKPLAPEVLGRLDDIAATTTGYSGADIESLFLTAANHAFANSRKEISMPDIDYAIDRTLLGNQNRRMTNEETKRRVAFHEAGHALVSALTSPGSVRKATIIPRGEALGYVAPFPKDMHLSTESELIDRLKMAIAGGAAEAFKFGEHSVGVSGDVSQIKRIVEQMVEHFGMGEGSFRVLFGKKAKEEQMDRIWERAERECRALLKANETTLDAIAEALLLKETLDGEEIESLVAETEKSGSLH